MKKRIISIFLCMAIGVTLTACGGSKTEESSNTSTSENAESVSSESEETSEVYSASTIGEDAIPILDKEDYTLDECITLCDYKGLEFTKTVEKVTEGQILLTVSQQTGDAGEELTDKDATVQEGDTAVIEYVGKKDGVAFDGGSSEEPYDLQIGSGSFIDGFEDGIIGMKAGETKDLNLTFPEDYQATDLAGQDVVFTVTVNSIKRLTIDDDWVKTNASEYADAGEFLDYVRETLKEQNEAEANSDLYSEVWSTVKENSTFLALPRKLVEDAIEEFDDQAAQQAESSGMELDEYIEQYCEAYGEDAYESARTAYAETSVENTLLREALVEAEGIEKDSDEYQEELDSIVSDSGAESADELIEYYGQDTIDDLVLKTLAVEKVLSYAKVTEA